MPLTLNGTTGVAGIDGSASTPSIQGTDTNTGVWFPAADTVAIATNGTERMRIDASGNVLVGASTAGSAGLNVAAGYNISFAEGSANTTYTNFFRQASSGAAVIGYGLKYSATANGFASSVGSSFARSAIVADYGSIKFYTDGVSTVASGTDITPTERARITSGGDFQFNSGYGSVATAYGCRAWVNFNGTGTVAIRASGNVSSITDNNTGDYTVNFTTALPDANYSSVVSLCSAFGFRYALGGQINTIAAGAAEQAPTTSAFRFSCIETAATAFDPKYASVAIFR